MIPAVPFCFGSQAGPFAARTYPTERLTPEGPGSRYAVHSALMLVRGCHRSVLGHGAASPLAKGACEGSVVEVSSLTRCQKLGSDRLSNRVFERRWSKPELKEPSIGTHGALHCAETEKGNHAPTRTVTRKNRTFMAFSQKKNEPKPIATQLIACILLQTLFLSNLFKSRIPSLPEEIFPDNLAKYF